MNALVLTHRLPFAPNRGDRIRAFHIVTELARSADVRVVSLVHDRAEEGQADTLRRLGIGVATAQVSRLRNRAVATAKLLTDTPLTHLLLDSPAIRPAIRHATEDWRPDVVVAYCSGIAPHILAPPLAGIPVILDLVDVDSAKWAAFAADASFPRAWVFRREARCLSAFEAEASRRAFAATVVNERERETLHQLSPEANIHVVPNGVDLETLAASRGPVAEPRVVFTAVFNYAPNADGAVWFARHVWPRVQAAVPAARLTLAGSSPTRAVRGLAAANDSIDVTGQVADMRPYLWGSAVAVAPIFHARGVQNKVLEAAAAGLPSVVTRAVWDGLPDEVLPACRQADDPREFAAAIIALLRLPPAARRQTAASARLKTLGWRQRLAPFVRLVEAAAAGSANRSRHYGRLRIGASVLRPQGTPKLDV